LLKLTLDNNISSLTFEDLSDEGGDMVTESRSSIVITWEIESHISTEVRELTVFLANHQIDAKATGGYMDTVKNETLITQCYAICPRE
jgi:hypothetical protein